jgi:actin-related protein
MVDKCESAGPALVLDNGSGNIKIGYAGENEPRSIFPSIVGNVRPQHFIQGLSEDGYLVGSDAA